MSDPKAPPLTFYFSESRLREMCQKYVMTGPEDTKSLRQEEADGTLAVVLSPVCEKLRVTRAMPDGQGIINDKPAQPMPPKTTPGE